MSSVSAAVSRARLAPVPWQQALREGLRTFADLVAAGLVPGDQVDALEARFGHLQLGIPRQYAARFRRNEGTRCPLWRQAVPWSAEDDPVLPGWAEALSQACYGRPVPWQADAIGDVDRLAAPRLTHRYRRRALVHVTAACALYCRFCFRKAHLSARSEELYGGPLAPAWAYVAAHPEIDEVVLSGGDPLAMGDTWWRQTLTTLDKIPHVKVLRVHSRMPATVPQRLTKELVAAFAAARPQLVLVSHFNHPRELGRLAERCLARARKKGVLLLNQSVVLRGINDASRTLVTLQRRLYQSGVVPYYLHHPDYTTNTWGFRLSLARGRALVRAALDRLSGPMRPRYMLELPGGHGKIDLLAQDPAPSFRRHDRAAKVGAARYLFAPPTTRIASPQPVAYLDLYPL